MKPRPKWAKYVPPVIPPMKPSQRLHRLVHEAGLATTGQLAILDAIAPEGSQVCEICHALGMPDSSVDRTMQKLRRLELVEAVAVPGRRINRLTGRGRELVEGMRGILAA